MTAWGKIKAGTREYLFGEKRGYRDLWLFIASGLLVLSLIFIVKAVHQAESAAHESKVAISKVQTGRKAATGFTCAAASALAQAGREVVEQSNAQRKVPTPKAEKLLLELGFPPLDQREAAAKATGRAYTHRITELVEQKAGVPRKIAASLIEADGSLNCARLRELAKVK